MAFKHRLRWTVAVLCAVVTALVLVWIGPVLAQGLSATYPQTTLEPHSQVARMKDDLLRSIVFWVIVIFVVVEAALVFTVFKFRHRPGGPAPKMIHGNTVVEIAWTIAPALILAFIAVPTVQTIFHTQEKKQGDLEVRVIGRQWWWEVHYPGRKVITANEIHVPVGKTVSLSLESADVIHSFWVPAFAGKRDLIPGRTNHLWFTPEKTGTFPGQCAEFCGASHANMLFKVVVQTPEEFEAWVAQQATPAPLPDSTATLAQQGLEIYRKGQCVACHMIDGVSYGVLGPNLSKVATRQTLASGILPNDEEHLRAWIRNAPAKKPGSLMPEQKLSDEELDALVAFLQTRR